MQKPVTSSLLLLLLLLLPAPQPSQCRHPVAIAPTNRAAIHRSAFAAATRQLLLKSASVHASRCACGGLTQLPHAAAALHCVCRRTVRHRQHHCELVFE